MITTLDELRAQIHELNLSHFEADIMSVVKPCIYLIPEKPDNDTIQIGTSRFGGNPDLPVDFQWLTYGENVPLTFIAQFRLSEVAPYDVEKLLPPQGMLYFFYAADTQPWGFPGDEDGWKIVYIQDEGIPLVTIPHPHVEGEWIEQVPFSLHYISFVNGLSLPTYIREVLEYSNNTDSKIEVADVVYYDFLRHKLYHEYDSVHQLFGHAVTIAWDVRTDCVAGSKRYDELSRNLPLEKRKDAFAEEKRKWQLLLQVDSDVQLRMMWRKEGRLYMCIRKPSRQQGQFDDCWTVLQSYN